MLYTINNDRKSLYRMNKYEIKEVLNNYNLHDYNYIYKDTEYVYLTKRNNDFNSKNYGEYKTIKCTFEDIENGNIEKMTLKDITRN